MANTVNLDQVEEFVVQSIQRFAPDFDLSKSDPFYDLFVRTFRQTELKSILELYQDIIDARSLLNTNVSNELYDRLLSNLQFSRKTATKHGVKYQLVVSEPIQLQIRTTDIYAINDQIYHPKYNLVINESDYTIENSLYVVEYELVAETEGFNSAVGVSTTVSTPFDSANYFVRAFTSSITQIGKDAETNLEALNRLQNEFGLETAVNKRGINFILSKYFGDFVQNTYIAGFSESEQKRDIRSLEIAKRIARLFFSEKINLTIPSNTKFYYGFNAQNKYILKDNASESFPINSSNWKQHPTNGRFYVDVEIELEDLFSNQEFREDLQINCDYLTNSFNTFLGATSKTNLLETSNIRIGSHTDIYVKTNTSRVKFSLYVPIDSNGIVSIPLAYQPLLKIHNIQEQLQNGQVVDVPLYSLIVPDPKLRFSSKENLQLFIQPSKVGTTVIIDATIAEKIQEIQRYFDLPLVKIISEDVLIRYYNPCFVGVVGIISGNSSLDSQIKTAITDYVNNLKSGTWTMAEFVSSIATQVPAFRTIFLDSLLVLINQVFPDGTDSLLEGEEIITPIEDDLLGVSIRNTTYILESCEIKYV